MSNLQPRYDKDEFARRGQEVYDRDVKPRLQPTDDGKFVAIDIETSAFEADWDDYTATEKLLVRNPEAQIWLVRAGSRVAYKIGGR